jgi:LacI family transcriptional regulator
MRQPTRDDVARHAQVSGSTVSRVLSGRTDIPIDAATRARVLAAAARLGYRANHLARALASGRTNTIGLLTIDSFTPFYGSIARHLTRLAEARGYRLAVQHAPSVFSDESTQDIALHSQVDGLIVCDLHAGIVSELSGQAPSPFPIVNVGVFEAEGSDGIRVDLLPGARQALAHLTEQGYRRIAYMQWAGGYDITEPRCRAYHEAICALGREPELINVHGMERRNAREAIAAYVREHGCPEAIFCRNDDIAIGCYRGLRDIGLSVPGDVALVGCDGIEDTEYLDCPLTTVVQPVEEMCALAWEYLEQRLHDNGSAPRYTPIVPQLSIRCSSIRSAR